MDGKGSNASTADTEIKPTKGTAHNPDLCHSRSVSGWCWCRCNSCYFEWVMHTDNGPVLVGRCICIGCPCPTRFLSRVGKVGVQYG